MGKKIKVNDFKFKYGQDVRYVNVYAVFKYTKNNDKYILYSYDNTKLYYGSAFIKNNQIVVMQSNKIKMDIVEKYIDNILNKKTDEELEELTLDNIDSIELIEENILNKSIDVNKIYEFTMPKKEIKKEVEIKKKKRNISISVISFVVLIILIIAFFFFNPEILIGKDITVNCNKKYYYKELNSNINEEVVLIFNGRNKLKSSTRKTDYVFTSNENYSKFRNDGLFYKYMDEGDTYKFIDNENTYRVITKIDNMEKYELVKEKNKLIKYYQDNKYNCQ